MKQPSGPTRLRRAFLASAVLVHVVPALAQDAPVETLSPRSRTQPPESLRQLEGPRADRFDQIRRERQRMVEQAPRGFEGWVRALPFEQRRSVDRRLRRMSDFQRDRFFRDWDRMTVRERRDLADQFTESPTARRPRELPPRLRTPEMRDRIERMTPDQRRAFYARAREWLEMAPQDRRRMHRRLERFGSLSADEQRALVEQSFRGKTQEQREQILSDLRGAAVRTRERERRWEAAGSEGRGLPKPSPQGRAPEPN